MTEKRTKRKLTAILSADVKGYSRIMAEDELGTIKVPMEYGGLINGRVTQFNGRVVDSHGDSLLAEFMSIVGAVESAIEIQKSIRAENAQLPEKHRTAFRIGISIGDVIEKEARVDGDLVNMTARLEGLAEAGGICISGTAYDQVRNKIPVAFTYLGGGPWWTRTWP